MHENHTVHGAKENDSEGERKAEGGMLFQELDVIYLSPKTMK